MIFSGIYCILCIITDKFYIGSAKDFKYRWYKHTNPLKNNKHSNRYLQSAWNKYGQTNFMFVVLEYCEPQKLIEREQFYIDTLKPEYNLAPKAGNTLGVKYSEESKRKIGATSKGRIFSQATRLQMSMKRKGMRQSKESIELSAQKRRGFKHTDEAKLKISLSKIGTKQSQETVNKRALKNRKLDKWPCSDGRKCKCGECMEKKRIYMRNWFNSERELSL